MNHDSGLEWGPLNYVRALDAEKPDHICSWCFYPRNSDECQFAAGHTPYREWFADF